MVLDLGPAKESRDVEPQPVEDTIEDISDTLLGGLDF